ncbi:ribosome small subunit-dependent GTPase A [Chitinivorax sp. PXF-14]|uniref:ribosome small subunit-dependent GTPase A n=1 Tax=Chitinivorax sp. PXF-14 TaxID=3230488 RepID=UPI00346620E4
MAGPTTTGRIVTSYGRSFRVEVDDRQVYECSVRGKRTDLACGDVVEIRISNAEQAVIERALPRKSLLYRADDWRQKLIAANVTQVVVVLAPFPSFSEDFLGRCLLACEAADIEPLIVLNKCDLPEAEAARQRLAGYRELGYRLLELTARQSVDPLRPFLDNHVTVLIGQSGMGKSTIINTLLPQAQARVGDISIALDSGKHTTTHATLYHLNDTASIIDSPGMQEFGLKHLDATTLDRLFPEMREHVGQCRFRNCRHRVEPGCIMDELVRENRLAAERLAFYRRVVNELA